MKKIGITLLILVLLAGALGGVYAISNGFKDWGKLAPKPNDPTQGKVGFTITVGNEDIMINEDTERIELNRNDSWIGTNIKSFENLPNYITEADISFRYDNSSKPSTPNSLSLMSYEGQKQEHVGFENFGVKNNKEANIYKSNSSYALPDDLTVPACYLMVSFGAMKNEASYLLMVKKQLAFEDALAYGGNFDVYSIPVYYVE